MPCAAVGYLHQKMKHLQLNQNVLHQRSRRSAGHSLNGCRTLRAALQRRTRRMRLIRSISRGSSIARTTSKARQAGPWRCPDGVTLTSGLSVALPLSPSAVRLDIVA